MLESTKLELKSANNRIKTLQKSLAGDDGDDDYEDEGTDGKRHDSEGDSDGSYQIGQFASSDDEMEDEDDEIDKFLKNRKKTSREIENLLSDTPDVEERSSSRKRLDELLASGNSPEIKLTSHARRNMDDYTKYEHSRKGRRNIDLGDSDEDIPRLSTRTKKLLDDDSDIEDVPAIKPRKTLEELLRSDSESEKENL